MLNREDKKKQFNMGKRVGVLCAVLIVCVALTMTVLLDRTKKNVIKDGKVINLISDSNLVKDFSELGKFSIAYNKARQVFGSNPGDSKDLTFFEASDNQKVWQSETEVEIFHISYNEKGDVTVKSAGDDKVVAPGTANDYSFKFKNNGSMDIDYNMLVEATITPEGTDIPLEAKLNKYDGSYLVGSDSLWDGVLKLDGVTDEATLSPNKYATYTLKWQWPFETLDEDGNVSTGDGIDTLLGNRAVDEDLIVKIKIMVVAMADEPEIESETESESETEVSDVDPDEDDTEKPSDEEGGPGHNVQTNDNFPMVAAVATAISSLILVIIFILLRKREDEEEK